MLDMKQHGPQDISKINRKPHVERRKANERRDKSKDDDRGNLLGKLDTKYTIAFDDGNK